MKKKLIAIGIVTLMVTAPMFATNLTETTATGGDTKLNLSFVTQAVNLIVGIFAGGYVLLKAALDIFHAVRNSSEDQSALKKAIGSFVLNAAILGGFMFVINYVFGKVATGGTNVAEGASGDFFKTLSGAIISL